MTARTGASASDLVLGADGPVWHTLSADRVLVAEEVDGQFGLSSAEAAARTQRFGPNKFDAAKAEPRWRAFIRQYADPMQIVLLVAGVVSLYPLKEWETGIVLILLTLFNAVLGLHQEGKAAAAVTALQKMMIIKAKVMRDGHLEEIPAAELVPGDVVSIEAGDIVPADGRLLQAAKLEVAESALTGESLPVAKSTEAVGGAGTPLGDRTDMVYMNTNVTRGAGEFVVTATGMATEVGHISGMLQAEQAVKTPLTRQLALVGIVDPPRATARASIATAKKAGIRVRMITGDHAVTAAAIARQLGIDGEVITGAEFGAMSDAEALDSIGHVGVIARVTPEHKVRLVDMLKKQGHVVAMTGDGVNDAPALKRADIGVAMGITGTEVTKEAAVMVLTDDNFSTIVKAVELGRGLYDNLTKYIRFQMGCLFGFIVSFLGASIFDITGGVPFLPLQTLWINFTTLLFQAIGLGYGRPAPGLMERRPRQSDRPILTRGGYVWLISAGLVMGAGTLGVLSWAEQVRTQAIAHTMGVVTFSLYALFFSIVTKDERRTVFSLDTFSDSKFVIATGASVLTLLLSTVFGPLQTFLKTTSLDVQQWLICLAVALSIVVVSEIRKAVRRKTATEAVPAGPPSPSPQSPQQGDETPRPFEQNVKAGLTAADPPTGT